MKDEALRLALDVLRNGARVWDAVAILEKALANDALDKMAENERELGIQMQPDPEPVAECVDDGEGGIYYRTLKKSIGFLYPSPPKREWQDLTETEWREIDERHDWRTTQGRIDAAEEIEAKLKEKNG